MVDASYDQCDRETLPDLAQILWDLCPFGLLAFCPVSFVACKGFPLHLGDHAPPEAEHTLPSNPDWSHVFSSFSWSFPLYVPKQMARASSGVLPLCLFRNSYFPHQQADFVDLLRVGQGDVADSGCGHPAARHDALPLPGRQCHGLPVRHRRDERFVGRLEHGRPGHADRFCPAGPLLRLLLVFLGALLAGASARCRCAHRTYIDEDVAKLWLCHTRQQPGPRRGIYRCELLSGPKQAGLSLCNSEPGAGHAIRGLLQPYCAHCAGFNDALALRRAIGGQLLLECCSQDLGQFEDQYFSAGGLLGDEQALELSDADAGTAVLHASHWPPDDFCPQLRCVQDGLLCNSSRVRCFQSGQREV